MIYKYFKVSDTDESVLDVDKFLNVKLKSFNMRSVGTIIVMEKQLDDEMLGYLYSRQLQQSEQLKPLLPLYTQATV